jgi:acetoin utilization deacetylase AcuC-like enzyme
MKPTGLIRSKIYLKHNMGMYHPESPERLEVLYQMLDQLGSALNFDYVEPRPASPEELSANHDPRYIDRIMSTR